MYAFTQGGATFDFEFDFGVKIKIFFLPGLMKFLNIKTFCDKLYSIVCKYIV